MSHMSMGTTGKPMMFGLRKPFGWYAVIRIRDQKRSGRKVIYDIGHTASPVRLTIGLDAEDDFCVWVTDAEGRQHGTEGIPTNEVKGQFIVMSVELAPGQDEDVVVRQAINFAMSADFRLTNALGDEARAEAVIGASLEESENAAFELGELVITGQISEYERHQLHGYFANKWGLLYHAE